MGGEETPSPDKEILVVGANPLERRALRTIIDDLGFSFTAMDIANIRDGERITDFRAVIALVPDSGHADLLARVFEETPVIIIAKNKGAMETVALPESIYAVLDTDFPSEKLLNLIPLVLEGFYIAPSLAHMRSARDLNHKLSEAASRDEAAHRVLLTTREMDVISHIAAGLSNKEIARELSIAVNTVNVHVNSVIRKLRVSNRTQIAMWYTNQGQ